MALPLNVYTTVFNTTLSAAETSVYTTPIGYNSIPLAISACNTSGAVKEISLQLANPADDRVNIVSNFEIPAGDTADLSVGKIVVPQNWQIYVTSTDATIHLVISLLETKL